MYHCALIADSWYVIPNEYMQCRSRTRRERLLKLLLRITLQQINLAFLLHRARCSTANTATRN